MDASRLGAALGQVVGAVVGGYIAFRILRKRLADRDATRVAAVRDRFRAAGLDDAEIDRRVAAERALAPRADEAECHRAALARWEREVR